MFSAQTYSNRRAQLAATVQKGVIVLLGNEESPMNYKDNPYAFRQDSNFLYFSGLNRAGLALIIDTESGETTLLGEEWGIDYVIWMGPQLSMAAMAHSAGITQTGAFGDLEKHLRKAQTDGRPIHFLPPYRAENSILLSQILQIPLTAIPEKVSIALIKAVIILRAAKSSEEVAEIEKAVNATGKMHIAAMKAAKAGISEADLTGIVEGIAASAGGGVLPYPVILSVNGQILHNHYHGNTLHDGQLVLGDFGAATSMQYAGDITRTFPVAAAFSAQQKEIYQIVLDAEMSSINKLRPGIPYREVHLGAAKIITQGLQALGIMKGDADQAVEAGAHALFFPHGLGHMLGLDVHDMEDLGEDYVGYAGEFTRSTQFGFRSLRLARKLQPGFVLTVEPGIYFIPELIDIWEAEGKHKDFIEYSALKSYREFGGIRIEDNVLITTDDIGHKVLGNPIPKTIQEVEALRIQEYPLL